MGIFDSLKKKSAKGKSAVAGKAPQVKQAKKEQAPIAPAYEHVPEEAPREKRAVHPSSRAHAVLLRPYLSEKAAIAESLGTYTFVVANDVTKHAVAQAVKDAYGIRPVSVRVVRVQGKVVRSGRGYARRSDWKKALVTLPKGQSIRIHEGV
jgi:large subunit ribosomal protein L23